LDSLIKKNGRLDPVSERSVPSCYYGQDPVTQLFTSTISLNDEGTKYDLELSKKDDSTKHRAVQEGLVARKAKVMLDESGTPRESHQAIS
jgi:hypothetical protein